MHSVTLLLLIVACAVASSQHIPEDLALWNREGLRESESESAGLNIEQPVREITRRICGKTLSKYLSRMCGGPCTTGVDLATTACAHPHTNSQLMELCCPDVEQLFSL
uniref:INSulin related n=1 Tax=Caenorhabditis japonica TaxID=281687 RepID=A0A8R1EGC2_CAEJA